MWQVLSKIFIRSFYKANAGFFLFFFFLFFGAVQGSSLVQYHLSLMTSFLQSPVVLLLVFCCWLLYHLKCTAFVFNVINSEAGKFLVNLQTRRRGLQWRLYTVVYLALYGPVFVYGILAAFVGFRLHFVTSAVCLLVFQVLSAGAFTYAIHYRLNHWLEAFRFPTISLPFPKSSLLFVFYYFTTERKSLLLALKAFSITLLYLILVWNKGRYDNDAFLFFYLVLLLAHAAIPYFSVKFWEQQFAVHRNMPVALAKRALWFLVPYGLLLLPEAGYLFYAADAFSVEHKLAYCINLVANLALLTAILYSEAQHRDEYLKACFGLVFVSIFFLHVQAFWFWIVVQSAMAVLLFVNGYYRFEKAED